MDLKINRSFKNGRQSEQFLNDELTVLYETLKYLPHHKQDHDGQMPPPAKLGGAINAQIPANVGEDSSLNYWDVGENKWLPFFSRKFQITDQILYENCPGAPVPGQLWLNNGALYYFDGRDWHAVKTIQADDSQWANGAFADFMLISPLNPTGQYVVPVGSGELGKDQFIYNYAASFVVEDPTKKMYATDRTFKSGQSEVTIHLNGLLLTFGRDWEEITPDATPAVERSTPCKAFWIKIDLQKNDVISYHIARKMLPKSDYPYDSEANVNEDYHQYFFENEIDYLSDNIVIPSTQRWTPDWVSPELDVPEEVIITDEYLSQFPIPNIKTDRIFLDNTYDRSYKELTTVCFQYQTNRVLNHIVSGLHLNPGKLTGIKKRLIKVDKLNATIAVSPYNTEFYGFRDGEYTGSFLIPSNSQDYGDYVSAGNHIILNYHSNQNYDYILAITYEFGWLRSDGTMRKSSLDEMSSAFYLSNLQEPLNVHVNGLKLEEASYDLDMVNKTVTLEDSAANVNVQAWSPYKKQFGYIRETDLENRGIIRLHEPVQAPIVFVGGVLIHPLYGGLVYDEDKIYVPNSGNMNQMKNMQWCVVDLISDNMDVQYQQMGLTKEIGTEYITGSSDNFVAPDSMYMAGTSSAQPDSHGVYDYILSSGTLQSAHDVVVQYDPAKIAPEDGVLLFIDGLLVAEEDMIRDTENGIIRLVNGLEEDEEYVLLKDRGNAIYNSTNMVPAFGVGFLSDSLVYLNGKLLGNTNCVMTLNTPKQEVLDGVVDHEIKYFVTNEAAGTGRWRIYDQYNYTWRTPTSQEVRQIMRIVDSYENLLTTIKFNIDYDKANDDVVVYTFKFANDLAGLTKVGEATYLKNDEDGTPLYTIGADYYGYEQGTLNLWKNGVKLINGRDYEETPQGKWIRLLVDMELTDKLQYVVEAVEHGYSKGHTFVTLTKEDSLQPNVYKIPDDVNVFLYPGRLTVYINGIRIPNTDWNLLTNKTILLKYEDYKAIGSAHNYPREDFLNGTDYVASVTHEQPDEIMIEIRNDYERQEKTVYLPPMTELNELSIEEYDLDKEILDSADEILFYLNGQFAGLSRNKNNDYRLDRYKGCIAFMNPDFLEAIAKDELKYLFDQDNYIYTAWKKMTGQSSYTPAKTNALTIVWR